MKVIITKPTCIIGNNKHTIRFEASTPSHPFLEVFNQIYAHFKHANAAKPFIKIKTTTKLDKTIEQIKPKGLNIA
ncbi:hypothetical protein [Bartonella raoultii]|uniref:hypothetical protein n=1 Tax=Bartonella raoultii TaxID=1457020 RepID=UPI001ABBCC92|nr:hypothetical protein [Bartonella raoultii]